MKTTLILFLLAALAGSSAFAAGEDVFYKLGPDSLPQEGVPKGKLIGPMHLPSQVFSNYTHTTGFMFPPNTIPSSPPV